MSITKTVNGAVYGIEKPDAMTAWELHRRVSPIALAGFQAIAIMGGGEDAASLIPALQVFAPAFARLPKDDAEFILKTCLSNVTRQDANGSWPAGRVFNGGTVAYSDISPATIDILIFEVLRLALGNFIQELATALPSGKPQGDTGSLAAGGNS